MPYFPPPTSGANPTALVGLSAVNGSAATFLRSDGAPALDVTISPTWTGVHTFTPAAAASPAALVWSGPKASGTNNAAGAWTHVAPLSTGNATNPDLIFQTGVKVASGTAQATATTALTIKGETQLVVFGASASFSGTGVGITIDSTTAQAVVSNRYATGVGSAGLALGHARGSIASPTDLVANDGIGSFIWKAYINGAFRENTDVVAYVDGTPSSTSYPSRISFQTTANAAVATTEVARIDQAGIFVMPSTGLHGWTSGALSTAAVATADTFLGRGANAATLQLGAATGSGAAVAQTLQVQGSSGNSAAAALFTIAGSDQAGTTTTGGGVKIRGGNGTSAGGTVEIWTSATTTPAVALTIGADKSAKFAGNLWVSNTFVATPQVPTGYIVIYDSTGTPYKVSVNP